MFWKKKKLQPVEVPRTILKVHMVSLDNKNTVYFEDKEAFYSYTEGLTLQDKEGNEYCLGMHENYVFMKNMEM